MGHANRALDTRKLKIYFKTISSKTGVKVLCIGGLWINILFVLLSAFFGDGDPVSLNYFYYLL